MRAFFRFLVALAPLAVSPLAGHAAEYSVPVTARDAPQTAVPADKRTHILTIAACPTRPRIGTRSTEACARFLPQMSAALAQRLGAEPADVHQLLNAQATGPAVLAAIRRVGRGLGPNDRLVIYMLSHGGGIARAQGKEEMFMLWTESQPAFIQLGIAQGVYVPAADLAAAVHATHAGEVVVMLDGCEAGLADEDFISRHPAKKVERAEAVVMSSGGTQFAKMDTDFSPVFGARLLIALQRAQPTLADAVADASAATSRDTPDICRTMLERYPPANAAPVEPSMCAQDPARDDPTRLLTRIPLRPVQRAASN